MNHLTRAVACRKAGETFIFRYHAWYVPEAIDAITAAAMDRSCVLGFADLPPMRRAILAMWQEDVRAGVYSEDVA